ncbi:HEAT repeat domain-containing protein [Paenibacillus contaminans]|uniref:HEAT repeat domain-containing protein n=1 Tax=Paenibacillus contaminans TaxID=450362 RepID=A0A329MDZ4_9BACL|nr:HEAT repeat domain-containing protein [Paenibacillus contaminans]RAV17858.1 HEAT repeat domain-containing protein [Paenibacillus contaminans]
MEIQELKNELPPNYEQLKSSANRASNWRERLAAVEELGQWKNQKVIDVLTHRMNADAVSQVREAAFRKLKELGEEAQLPVRENNDFLIKDVTKILIRIKKSLPKDHTYEAFKEKLQKMRLDVYDTYEGEKGADFDQWLENKWASLSTR